MTKRVRPRGAYRKFRGVPDKVLIQALEQHQAAVQFLLGARNETEGRLEALETFVRDVLKVTAPEAGDVVEAELEMSAVEIPEGVE